MALSIQQSASYLGKDRWSWSVWVDGPPEELETIDHVVYILDPTFHDPVRLVKDRSTKFRLDTSSWGVFMIHAQAVDREGHETPLHRKLELIYPDGTPTTA